MNRREFLVAAGAGLGVAPCLTQAAPPPPPSPPLGVLLWCWDARMTWDDEPATIATRMAAAEEVFPYPKRPESFLVGCKRLVDYCALIGVRGFTLWGFLRDSHGGVSAGKELCQYAADRGVAVLPGVGLCSYGGYFYEGEHPFNLRTYLRAHPDRASQAAEQGSGRLVGPVLDPSLEANRSWWRDGLEWMLESFAIGGIDFEMGDFIVNPSAGAAAARDALGFEADDNIKDIVVATKELMAYATRNKPDGLFINCTYRGYQQLAGFPRMDYTKAIPLESIWEYTLDGMVRRPEFPDGFAGAPDHRRYGYLHWFNASTKTMQTDYTAEIARVFPALRRLGFEFAGTYGEISAIGNPLADSNYRAQVAWGGAQASL